MNKIQRLARKGGIVVTPTREEIKRKLRKYLKRVLKDIASKTDEVTVSDVERATKRIY